MNKISIIIPTFREADNIPELLSRIESSLKNTRYKYEIIIVDDDSRDGIEGIIFELQKKYCLKLKIRYNERGLASAVIDGFRLAAGEIYLVMDADLSHPPEYIPGMIDKISHDNFDFVIGSRFINGGAAEHNSFLRSLNALGAKLFARPFTDVKDPMAGFFAFRSGLLKKGGALNPLGFKIGLELIVKLQPERITEIPIRFQERLNGESKLTMKQQVLYLIHIWRLFKYKHRTLSEITAFLIVGSSGMAIDLISVFLSYDILNIPFRIARVIGFLFALTSNFLLNRRFTFLKNGHSIIKQYIRFFVVCLTGFALNWTISVYLYDKYNFFHAYYLLAAFLGIAGGFIINFTGSKIFVFRKI